MSVDFSITNNAIDFSRLMNDEINSYNQQAQSLLNDDINSTCDYLNEKLDDLIQTFNTTLQMRLNQSIGMTTSQINFQSFLNSLNSSIIDSLSQDKANIDNLKATLDKAVYVGDSVDTSNLSLNYDSIQQSLQDAINDQPSVYDKTSIVELNNSSGDIFKQLDEIFQNALDEIQNFNTTIETNQTFYNLQVTPNLLSFDIKTNYTASRLIDLEKSDSKMDYIGVIQSTNEPTVTMITDIQTRLMTKSKPSEKLFWINSYLFGDSANLPYLFMMIFILLILMLSLGKIKWGISNDSGSTDIAYSIIKQYNLTQFNQFNDFGFNDTIIDDYNSNIYDKFQNITSTLQDLFKTHNITAILSLSPPNITHQNITLKPFKSSLETSSLLTNLNNLNFEINTKINTSKEIDRVFKKINEGLEIFDTYHERHENSTNPSQRDKLESVKIKKLQKLREQIKVWQTQNEVKDKDKLLEYRRLVETAMEKYKVVEKGSKVKAYSNMSLKQGADLDPEEQEKLDTINFLQESIDDIERQYQVVEVEIEKLSGKKSKKNSSANETKKEELKELQTRYRWHQQQLELALRLLENDELQVADILEIKEDLIYFLQSNRDPNFIDNEYIYESLDLESNELLSNEVVSSFQWIITPAQGPPGINPVRRSETPKKKFVSLSTNSNTSTPTSLSSTLKPAAPPSQPPSAMKWSILASGGFLNNNGNGNGDSEAVPSSPAPPSTAPAQITTATSSNATEVPITPSKTTSVSPSEGVSNSLNGNVSIGDTARSSSSNLAISPVNQVEYQQDVNLLKNPPGINAMIASSISSRTSSNNGEFPKSTANVRDLLRLPRDYMVSQVEPSQLTTGEYQRVAQLYEDARHKLSMTNNFDAVLSGLDILTLFFGFYYSTSPIEHYITERELQKKKLEM
ncbi:unnamed protein product [Wickerhamomyces anomalus]